MNYEQQLALAHIDGNAVSMDLAPEWLQGRSAFGGWQAALAVQAMRAVLGDDTPLRSLQVNFIAPVPPGTITANAELLRRGKSAAQLEARILVDGKTAFLAVGIFGLPRQSSIVEQAHAPAAAAEPDSIPNWPHAEGVAPVFAQNFHIRWAKGKPPFSGAEHADAQIFVRYRDDQLNSEAHLVCIADAIPPSAISMLKEPAMLSSMNWTLEFVNPLQDDERNGWLRFDSTLTAAADGYAWENTAIWSAKGNLIALSRQCVAIFG